MNSQLSVATGEPSGRAEDGSVGDRKGPAVRGSQAISVSGPKMDAEFKERPVWLSLLEQFGLVALLILVVAFFAVFAGSRDQFLSVANIQNVLGNECDIIVLAIAALIPLISGRFDLSIGANAGLCSLACAAAMSSFNWPLVLALALTVTLGGFVGVFNGFLVAYMGLSSIVVTLATSTLISGLVLAYANGQVINLRISQTFIDFGANNWLGLPLVVYLTALVAIFGWYLLLHTGFGRFIRMAGGSPEAARLAGLNVRSLTFQSFVLCGVLGAVTGIIMCARGAGANPESGPDLLFPALTAVFLGATCIRPGEFNIVGTIVAALFLAAAVSGMAISGAPAWVEPVFDGVALLIGIAIYVLTRKQSSGKSSALSM